MENPECTCPKDSCPRHGHCTDCKDHHHEKGGLTHCERDGSQESKKLRKKLRSEARARKKEEKRQKRANKKKSRKKK